MAEKRPSTAQPRSPAQLKDVKLRDRIHLFEGLSNQSAVNNNVSANNSEQARYPKVSPTEPKRWTQVEADTPGVPTPPWQRFSKNEPLKSPAVPGIASPTTAERSAMGPAALTGPSPTQSNSGQFIFAEVDEGAPSLSSNPTNEAPTRSDVIYINGVPVRRRNGRKYSADRAEARSTVIAMIKNFETKADAGPGESQPKPNGASLDVNPGENIQRWSADVTSRVVHEKETVPTPVPQPRGIQRRRSKSVSDVHFEVATVPQPLVPPAKPKRTYDQDVYEESKALRKPQQQQQQQQQQQKQQQQKPQQHCGLRDSRLRVANPLYEIVTDEADGYVLKGRPESDASNADAKMPGKNKDLPPVPDIPPYTPLLAGPRGQSSEVSATRQNPSPHGPHTALRPRSETTPDCMSDQRSGNNLYRSHSAVDDSTRRSTPGSSHKLSKSQGHTHEYHEPMYPLYQKPKMDKDNNPALLDTVLDANGYSIPGSHRWREPEPPVVTTARHIKVQSLKHVKGVPVERFSEPNQTWRSLRIYEPDSGRMSVPGLGVIADTIDENVELSRKRQTSSEKRSATPGYTEPGSHVANETGLEPVARQRSRFGTMRRKLHEAFHVKNLRHPKFGLEDECTSVTSEDSDCEVSNTEMRKRISHVRTVKQRSSAYCNVELNRRINSGHKLYSYLLVITLELNETTRRYCPIEKYRYPEEISASHNDKLRAIPHFCFPDAFKWAPVEKYNSESYSFVLTNIDGSRLYGYNRRLLPPGDKPRLPEVYCIISPISCSPLYTQLLDGIEQHRHQSEQETEKLIREAHGRSIPLPGKSINIMRMGQEGKNTSTMQPLFLQRPADTRLEHVDFNCLFSSLEITQAIQVFASLLLERRIIMFSGVLSKLSKCSQAIAALLYPFAWQHVYVPVLPEKLIDMSCSPTPYIMGMLALCIPNVELLPIEEPLLVDLDSRNFYLCVGDEETLIPKRRYHALEKALRDILKSPTEDSDSLDPETKNRAISDVFVQFFVETCGHYTDHLKSDFEGYKKFDREGFIEAMPSRSTRRFLEVFTETQMFSVFIQEKEMEVEGITQGLFEMRVQQWKNECNAHKFGARVKKIGKVVKGISREGGKMMADTANVVRTKVKANLDSKV